jgi:hypothetical protein
MGKAREKVVDKLRACVDFDGQTLDNIAEEVALLKSMVADQGGDPDSAFIDYEHYGYDGAFEIVVKFERMESDKEYERRQKLEAKEREKERARKATAKEQRRKEFEKLKKEFGE